MGVREGQKGADGLNLKSREAPVRLVRRPTVVLVDEYDVRWHSGTSHNRLTGDLFRINFDEIATCPVHDASF
jgi:hypothetical protein